MLVAINLTNDGAVGYLIIFCQKKRLAQYHGKSLIALKWEEQVSSGIFPIWILYVLFFPLNHQKFVFNGRYSLAIFEKSR